MKTDCTIVAAYDDNGTILFIKTFDFDNEGEAAFECFKHVRQNFKGFNYSMGAISEMRLFEKHVINRISDFEESIIAIHAKID